MSSKSKTEEIKKFFTLPLTKNDVAVMYLGWSGVLVRTANGSIVIDPANILKGDDIKALKEINLLIFTHSHGDHFVSGETVDIFKSTGAPILAEPKVVDELKGKIPADKITGTVSGKTYTFGDITVKAVQGIHRGPIMLYQIKIGDHTMFHAGDSGYVTVKDYPSELAFLPTGSPSPTASPEDAFKMASELKPIVVVVIHGAEGQSKEFEKKVKEKMPQTTVVIMEPFATKTMALQGKK